MNVKPETYWKINIALLVGSFVVLSVFLGLPILQAIILSGGSVIVTASVLLVLVLCLWLLPLIAAIQFYRKKASGFYLSMVSATVLLILYLAALLLPVLQTVGYA